MSVDDFVVRHLVQVLDQRAQRVAVGGVNRLADAVASDDVGEIWQKPGDHVSQTFGERATADRRNSRRLADCPARSAVAACTNCAAEYELLFAIAGPVSSLVQTAARRGVR